MEVYCPKLIDILTEVEFDRSMVLPPDFGSEYLAQEGLDLLRWQAYFSPEQFMEKPLSIVVPGSGSGILTVCMDQLVAQDPILSQLPHGAVIYSFDSSPEAVETTARNVQKLDNPTIQHRVEQADWTDLDSLDWIPDLGVDQIIVNPPYLPEETELLPGYETAPGTALYAGQDGLEAYRQLKQLLLAKSKRNYGASFIGRISDTKSPDRYLEKAMDVAYNLPFLAAEDLYSAGPTIIGEDKWHSFIMLQFAVPLNSYFKIHGLHYNAKLTLEFARFLDGKVLTEKEAHRISEYKHRNLLQKPKELTREEFYKIIWDL